MSSKTMERTLGVQNEISSAELREVAVSVRNLFCKTMLNADISHKERSRKCSSTFWAHAYPLVKNGGFTTASFKVCNSFGMREKL